MCVTTVEKKGISPGSAPTPQKKCHCKQLSKVKAKEKAAKVKGKARAKKASTVLGRSQAKVAASLPTPSRTMDGTDRNGTRRGQEGTGTG